MANTQIRSLSPDNSGQSTPHVRIGDFRVAAPTHSGTVVGVNVLCMRAQVEGSEWWRGGERKKVVQSESIGKLAANWGEQTTNIGDLYYTMLRKCRIELMPTRKKLLQNIDTNNKMCVEKKKRFDRLFCPTIIFHGKDRVSASELSAQVY